MTVPTLTPPVPSPPAPRPRSAWGAGRVVGGIVAAVFLMLAVALVMGAGLVKLADTAMRDDAGYVTGTTTSWSSPGYALRTESVDLETGSTSFDLPHRLLGTVRVTAEATTPDGVFVGVARTADVDTYLAGVAQSTVDDPFAEDGTAGTTYVDGGPLEVAPADADIWTESASGTGTRSITWEPEPGSWTLVVLTGDGTAPVGADVTIGAELPGLDALAAVLLVSGLVLGGLAGIGLWLVLRTREEAPRAARA